jgi:hypothetical protein
MKKLQMRVKNTITFEEGCGRLTGAALGLRKAAEENPEIKAVLSCAIKMKGGS